MKTLRLCAVLVCAAHAAFAQDGASLLSRAKEELEELEADAAVKTLAQAEKQPGNSRATLEEIHLWRGIANGVLGNKPAMQDAFRWLLVVNPEAKLPKDQPPKVQTPFYEAKAWAETAGPLVFTPSAQINDGKITALVVKIEKDTLKLAKGVRFHLVIDGVNREQEEAMHGGAATTPVSVAQVSWWAEVLTENEGVLTTLSTRTDSATVLRDAVAKVEPAMVTQPMPGAGEWRRPFGATLLGVGGAAVIGGTIAGVLSRADRDKVNNATADGSGRITSITQRQALALESSARAKATAANALFISGGVLAAVGVVFIIWGPDKTPVAHVTPALGGLSVTGSF